MVPASPQTPTRRRKPKGLMSTRQLRVVRQDRPVQGLQVNRSSPRPKGVGRTLYSALGLPKCK